MISAGEHIRLLKKIIGPNVAEYLEKMDKVCSKESSEECKVYRRLVPSEKTSAAKYMDKQDMSGIKSREMIFRVKISDTVFEQKKQILDKLKTKLNLK